MTNMGPDKILDLNTSFERYFSKLSENHKNVDIGSTVLKLWLLKGVQLHPHPLHFIMSFSCHNLNSVDPKSNILESLQKDLSNGVIKAHIREIKVFAN